MSSQARDARPGPLQRPGRLLGQFRSQERGRKLELSARYHPVHEPQSSRLGRPDSLAGQHHAPGKREPRPGEQGQVAGLLESDAQADLRQAEARVLACHNEIGRSTSSAPPPMAAPCTQATTGIGL